MFSGSFDAYQRGQEELNKYNQSQKALEEASQANLTLEMRRKQVTEAYAVSLAPLRKMMANILGLILQLNEASGGWLIPVVGITFAVVALAGKLFMFVRVLGVLSPLLAGMGTVGLPSLAMGLTAISGPLAAFGAAAAGLLPILGGIAAVLGTIALIGFAFGGGDDDEDKETVKKADRINAAAKASAKLETGLKAITAMQTPLETIETSIDHIVEKINTMNTGALLLAGVTLSAAAPVAALAGATGATGGSANVAQEVGKAIETSMAQYKMKWNDRVLAEFIKAKQKEI
jgi:hypothetical protein